MAVRIQGRDVLGIKLPIPRSYPLNLRTEGNPGCDRVGGWTCSGHKLTASSSHSMVYTLVSF